MIRVKQAVWKKLFNYDNLRHTKCSNSWRLYNLSFFLSLSKMTDWASDEDIGCFHGCTWKLICSPVAMCCRSLTAAFKCCRKQQRRRIVTTCPRGSLEKEEDMTIYNNFRTGPDDLHLFSFILNVFIIWESRVRFITASFRVGVDMATVEEEFKLFLYV